MAEPTIALEIDFTNSGTWVDVSDWLVSLEVVRGRQRELDRFDAGRMTVTLRDDDRRFDPNHAGGAYYPDIKPVRPIRAMATWAAVEYPLFAGYIDRWTALPGGPHDAVVRVDATDSFKILARSELPTGAYAAEVAADTPAHWYRLDEPSGTTTFFDSVGGRDLTVSGTTEQVSSLLARDANQAVALASATDGAVSAPTVSPAVTALTAELVFQTLDPGSGQTLLGEVTDTVSAGWVIEADGDATDHQVQFTVKTSAGTQVLSSAVIPNGDIHHVMGVWDGTDAYLYIDGLEADTAALAGTLFAAGATTYVLLGGAGAGPIVNSGAAGTIDEAVIYHSALTDLRALDHADQVATPWDGDPLHTRADRVLDSINFTAGRDMDPGTATMGPATLGGTALDYLQKLAESDLGVLYVDPEGTLKMKGRDQLVNQPSLAAFSDAHGTDPAISVYQPEYGDDLIRNLVTVSREEGTAQTARDQDSIDEYLVAGYTLEGLLHDSDEDSRGYAELIVSEHAQPRQRISGLTVHPRGNAAVLFPDLLPLDLTAVVTVAVTPQDVGSETVQESMVEGITHRAGPKAWETILTLSPALGGETGFWELGEAGHSELGQTTRLFV